MEVDFALGLDGFDALDRAQGFEGRLREGDPERVERQSGLDCPPEAPLDSGREIVFAVVLAHRQEYRLVRPGRGQSTVDHVVGRHAVHRSVVRDIRSITLWAGRKGPKHSALAKWGMLDELLGRASLKADIADLEAEKRDLEAQLEGERERRAEAQTARQEAERRVNRLEDRIDQLEGDLDRLRGDEPAPEPRHVESLHGSRLGAVLDRLDSLEGDPESILTAYVNDGSDLPESVRDAFGDRAGIVAGAAPCLAVTDDAGLVGACLSTPVSPAPFDTWSDRVELERDWFEPAGEYTLALVRSDLFAMGSYEGRERVGFHGFTSDLKEQHSKGGFSQARFERLRDEQIDDHVERCRAALEEREADPVYLVGERALLADLGDLADVTRPVDATGDPEDALEDAVHSFWTVRLRAV